jgi:hypothetical protein
MSGVFSIVSHSMLQYFPEVTRQEQIGCAHFTPVASAISFLQSVDQSCGQKGVIQPPWYSIAHRDSVLKGTHCDQPAGAIRS